MKFPICILLLATAAIAQEPTGVPYSAQQVTEHVQTLSDGTHITQTPQKTNVYRDAQGRSRTERLFGPATATERITSIEISDAVAGVRYTLEPDAHIARQMTLPKSATAGATTEVAVAQSKTGNPQISQDSLGTQTIEGVLAQGTRTTTVYPTGVFGNDRPVTVTSERWVSPELHTTILLKISDPRTGESTTRLTNISRSEPEASLFRVPAGYDTKSLARR